MSADGDETPETSPPRKHVGLADASTSGLERIAAALRDGSLRAPLSRSSLIAFGVTGQLDAITAALAGYSRAACISILEAVLAEREKCTAPAPELVWTGPEGANAIARDTAVVLRELFESAHQRVILAGYSFDNGANVLRPLHAVMEERGVQAYFFVNIEQPRVPVADEDTYAQGQLDAFIASSWPFGAPYPRLYCDRRALRPGHGAEYCSLHAKCVSVDGKRAFVSSANFTSRGQDRNIEVGVLLNDATFASQVERQWMSLIEAGFVWSSPQA